MIGVTALSFRTRDFDDRLQLTREVMSAPHFSNPPMIIFMKGNLNEEEKEKLSQHAFIGRSMSFFSLFEKTMQL